MPKDYGSVELFQALEAFTVLFGNVIAATDVGPTDTAAIVFQFGDD